MHTFRHGSKIPMGFFQQFRHEHGLAAPRGTDHQNVGWGAKHDCDTRVWRSFLYVEKKPDSARIRTWTLPIRGRTPYPIGPQSQTRKHKLNNMSVLRTPIIGTGCKSSHGSATHREFCVKVQQLCPLFISPRRLKWSTMDVIPTPRSTILPLSLSKMISITSSSRSRKGTYRKCVGS